jgi:hypothetical protein
VLAAADKVIALFPAPSIHSLMQEQVERASLCHKKEALSNHIMPMSMLLNKQAKIIKIIPRRLHVIKTDGGTRLL